MHTELVGQEASLSLPCNVDVATLLFGFIHELIEVDGGATGEPERLENELKEAIDAMCRHGAEDAPCQMMARFAILDARIEVRLTCENGASGAAEHLIIAHEI